MTMLRACCDNHSFRFKNLIFSDDLFDAISIDGNILDDAIGIFNTESFKRFMHFHRQIRSHDRFIAWVVFDFSSIIHLATRCATFK